MTVSPDGGKEAGSRQAIIEHIKNNFPSHLTSFLEWVICRSPSAIRDPVHDGEPGWQKEAGSRPGYYRDAPVPNSQSTPGGVLRLRFPKGRPKTYYSSFVRQTRKDKAERGGKGKLNPLGVSAARRHFGTLSQSHQVSSSAHTPF
jgi:hypothetical protein